MTGSFQLLVLLAIRILKSEASGERIADTLGRYIERPTDGQVYVALGRLKDAGLVVDKPPIPTGRRGRSEIFYELTIVGRTQMEGLVSIIDLMHLEGSRDPKTGKIFLKIDPDLLSFATASTGTNRRKKKKK